MGFGPGRARPVFLALSTQPVTTLLTPDFCLLTPVSQLRPFGYLSDSLGH